MRAFLGIDGIVESAPASSAEAPDAKLETQETHRLIEKAMQTLPEKQRQVFIMRYYEEMPYDQMAAVLKKSVGGLKANYFHAVRKIEEYVKHAMRIRSI